MPNVIFKPADKPTQTKLRELGSFVDKPTNQSVFVAAEEKLTLSKLFPLACFYSHSLKKKEERTPLFAYGREALHKLGLRLQLKQEPFNVENITMEAFLKRTSKVRCEQC